jgi:ribonuclease P protein component
MSGRLTFGRSHRVRTPQEYASIYDARVRESRGPLMVYALPNGMDHPRLGLSTSRKVGTAPKRNRIRRLLREAFRHMQHDLPRGYDFVIVVRPHEPLALAEYQRLLMSAAIKLHAQWQRRESSKPPETPKLDPM